ncbi:UNVERIFIED_CONTAM: Transposon Ty3-G Gag-Pol polyprotein [Sesamum latifolium]|uniref:Transposon Ty3-G Gag-Pol polyprotein n=1 Tax=Sesamum latifolium TaxID=2727402 RepID=A0AAW2XK66_9LAMI
MGINNAELTRVNTPLTSFSGSVVEPVGEVTFPMSLGSYPRRITKMVKFLVVNTPSAYNVILGRSSLNVFQAIASTYHLKLKFPTPNGIGEEVGDRRHARECYANSLKKKANDPPNESSNRGNASINSEDVIATSDEKDPLATKKRKVEERMGPIEVVKTIELTQQPGLKTTKIETLLDPQLEKMLVAFLQENISTFAWDAADMCGIDPEYPDWLANVVLVPKANGKWRMCIDFSYLNKACPKDSYPFSRIDALIDLTSGCELMSFLDAFQGYNQIRLAKEDQEKTSFVTNQGIFCYNVMPFGLKNAGATYQRLVNHMFREQIGKTMEVYIDDMLVKSKRKEDHAQDLQECFGVLRRFGMKLNPAKCTFGVHRGKFLGFMISQRGIEVNPKKIKAILEMQPPKNIRKVQRLTGRLAALNRFISQSSDRGLPFFKVLKKIENF